VELVGDEEFGAGLALGVEHRSRDVDEGEARVLGAIGGDELVGEENFVADFGARGALLDREEDDFGLRERGVDLGVESLESGEDGLGRFTSLKAGETATRRGA
jgi:hypothetical protein